MSSFNKKINEYSVIYSDFYPVIFGTVFSKIRNTDLTKDICQEVFIRMYERFDEIENHRKWLYGTMRLVMLEFFRKNAKYKSADIDDVNLTYINAFKDTRIILEDAMNDMDNFGDEKNKIIFELVTIKNLTYKETAQQMGMSIHQIRYRLKIICNNLQKYFKEKGIDSLEELL